MALKFRVKFYTNLQQNKISSKKYAHGLRKTFYNLKSLRQIWGLVEISTGLGVFLKILSCGIF